MGFEVVQGPEEAVARLAVEVVISVVVPQLPTTVEELEQRVNDNRQTTLVATYLSASRTAIVHPLLMIVQLLAVVEILLALEAVMVFGTVAEVLIAGFDGVEIAVAGMADDVRVGVVSVLSECTVVREAAVASGTVGHDRLYIGINWTILERKTGRRGEMLTNTVPDGGVSRKEKVG